MGRGVTGKFTKREGGVKYCQILNGIICEHSLRNLNIINILRLKCSCKKPPFDISSPGGQNATQQKVNFSGEAKNYFPS